MAVLPHAKRGMDTVDPGSADPEVGKEVRVEHFLEETTATYAPVACISLDLDPL